ncbi:MAG: 4Fe-4S dicluster domain-containing protein, partial [Sporomusa sp.]
MTESRVTQLDNEAGLRDVLSDIVANCDRCGSCLTVCPLYGVTKLERSVARGKNSAIKAMLAQGLPIDAQISEMFNYCLLCKACANNCPSKIKTDEAMIKVREYLTAQVPASTVHHIIGFFMKNNFLISVAAAAINIAKKTRITALLPNEMIATEFTKTQYQKMFTGPALAPGQPHSDKRNKITAKSKIAYFRGCAMKLFFPEAAADSVRVLSKIGQVT